MVELSNIDMEDYMTALARILVIDDEPDIVEYLVEQLSSLGFEAIGSTNPEDAIKLAETERFLAIITDYQMPVLNGIDAVTKIIQTNLNAKTPFVVLSGVLTDEILLKLSKLGVINAMSKPPDWEVLQSVLKKAGASYEKKTRKSYLDDLYNDVHDSFAVTIREYVSPLAEISDVIAGENFGDMIEFCSLVSLFGQKVSAMISISFAQGFTREFAQTILQRHVTEEELTIFELSTGEMASFMANTVVDRFVRKYGIKMMASQPVVIHGRHAPVPMPQINSRTCMSAKLNGQKCYLDLTFIDMDLAFSGSKN